MKNSGTNKLKEFFFKNYKLLLLFCGLTLLNVFFLCWSFRTNNLTFGKTFIIMLLGSLLLEIILCLIILIAQKKSWKIEKTFLVLGLIIGILYVFALPIGRAPDEESHFFRVYELSNGHFVSDLSENGKAGSFEASNIEIIRDFKENNTTYNETIENLGLYPNEEEQTFVRTSAYSYNIFSYLPHVTGMTIGKIFNFPLLVTAYLAKIFNFITCLLILYFSIKYIPILKKIIFFIGLLPITMQAMTSLSPDGLVISMSIALISFVLYSIYTLKSNLSKKQLGLISLICLFVSMGKIAYSPLCLLLFAIPKERFGGKNKKILSILAIGTIVFMILLTWIIIAPSLQSSKDPSTQISLITSNPFEYLAILINSISANASMYLSGFLGGYLEWFNIVLSPIYIYTAFTIFVLLCKEASQSYSITKIFKALSIIIFTMITLLTFTTMFIQWTKVGETVIDGVQGRYFLPIALLIPTWFLSISGNAKPSLNSQSQHPKHHQRIPQNYYLYGFLIFESIYAITTIACSHL